MSSKLRVFTPIVLYTISLLLTIYLLYSTNYNAKVEYASYVYLVSSIGIALVLIATKEITNKDKILLIVFVTLVFIFSMIWSLIMLYSSPTNNVEVLASVIFFIAGSIVTSSIFFIKSRDLSVNKKELTFIHKTIRYMLFLIVILFFIQTLLGIFKILLTLNLG